MSKTPLRLPAGVERWRIAGLRVPACLADVAADADAEGLVRVDLTIAGGRIDTIAPAGAAPAEPDLPVLEAPRLGLPCFVDAHTHLDKGHIWPRAPNADGSFASARDAVPVDREARWTAQDVGARADFALASAYAYGTRAIRTHIDSIGPQTRLSWPVIAEARERWAGRIDLQASPLFGTDRAFDRAHMADVTAMVTAFGHCLGAVTYPGPTLRSELEALFRLASDRGWELDFHADETGDPAVNTLGLIAELALAFRFPHRVLCGHCCTLTVMADDERRRTIDCVAEAGLSVVSLPLVNMYLQDREGGAGRTPRWRGVTALKELKAAGVPVMIASDNTRDPFHAYGDLDMLEVWREGTRIAHLDHPFGDWVAAVTTTPARALGLGGELPLRAGAPADLVILSARSLSELMARPLTARTVIRDGRPIDAVPPPYATLDNLKGLALTAYDIAALKSRLGGIRWDDNPALVKQKSRDFYWYSPILKQQLEAVTGDIVVSPRSTGEVVEVLAAAHGLGIPVTPRGTGTGNYGQAMPLSGGIVLNLADMNAVTAIEPGRVVCEPGAVLADIDRQTRGAVGEELRMHPSTYNTASIGGFLAGGSSGVGSINWGGLRDLGNVHGVTVVTMEASPRVLALEGDDLAKVMHAYGTNGIITEVDMPLAQAPTWTDVIVGFDSFADAALFGNSLGEADGILTKLITPIAAPVPQSYFLRHGRLLPPGQSIVLVMVARTALPAFRTFLRRFGRGTILLDASAMAPADLVGLPPNYELSWNHTTLRALRVDPAITYLQVLFPFPDQLATIARVHAHFGDEVMGHLEVSRYNGKVTCFGLSLVRFTTAARLDEIIRIHEDMGAPVFNPHRYTLEEGGMKQTDDVQLAFKRDADPDGLLNPGKMIAWDDPAFDYRAGKIFLFPGLSAATAV